LYHFGLFPVCYSGEKERRTRPKDSLNDFPACALEACNGVREEVSSKFLVGHLLGFVTDGNENNFITFYSVKNS